MINSLLELHSKAINLLSVSEYEMIKDYLDTIWMTYSTKIKNDERLQELCKILANGEAIGDLKELAKKQKIKYILVAIYFLQYIMLKSVEQTSEMKKDDYGALIAAVCYDIIYNENIDIKQESSGISSSLDEIFNMFKSDSVN